MVLALEKLRHKQLNTVTLCWRTASTVKSEQIHQHAGNTNLIQNVKIPQIRSQSQSTNPTHAYILQTSSSESALSAVEKLAGQICSTIVTGTHGKRHTCTFQGPIYSSRRDQRNWRRALKDPQFLSTTLCCLLTRVKWCGLVLGFCFVVFFFKPSSWSLACYLNSHSPSFHFWFFSSIVSTCCFTGGRTGTTHLNFSTVCKIHQ